MSKAEVIAKRQHVTLRICWKSIENLQIVCRLLDINVDIELNNLINKTDVQNYILFKFIFSLKTREWQRFGWSTEEVRCVFCVVISNVRILNVKLFIIRTTFLRDKQLRIYLFLLKSRHSILDGAVICVNDDVLNRELRVACCMHFDKNWFYKYFPLVFHSSKIEFFQRK